jgi:hypothetical protein
MSAVVVRFLAVLGDECFDHIRDLLLLSPWQTGNGLKNLSDLALGGTHELGFSFAKQLLHGDAEGSGHRHENIGARQVAAGLPIPDVGMILTDAAGEFTQREPGGLAELLQTDALSFCSHEISIKRVWKKPLHVGSILPIIGQCNKT